MRRREFLAVIGAAVPTKAIVASAQHQRVRSIAILIGVPKSEPEGQVRLKAFQARPVLNPNRDRINALAPAARLPTIPRERGVIEDGGLTPYGPSFPYRYRRAAEYVYKILRSAEPAGIPVEEPIKSELIVYLDTAMAIGLNIPTLYSPPPTR